MKTKSHNERITGKKEHAYTHCMTHYNERTKTSPAAMREKTWCFASLVWGNVCSGHANLWQRLIAPWWWTKHELHAEHVVFMHQPNGSRGHCLCPNAALKSQFTVGLLTILLHESLGVFLNGSCTVPPVSLQSEQHIKAYHSFYAHYNNAISKKNQKLVSRLCRLTERFVHVQHNRTLLALA